MAASEKPHPAWIKFGALILVLVSFYAAGGLLGLEPDQLQPEVVRDYVAGFGILAPAIFVGIYTMGALLLVPGAVLSIAAGLAFGWKLGFVVVVLGSNLGANLAFALGKLLGRDLVQRLSRGRLDRFDQKVTAHGFHAIFLLRLVPLVPFEALNYGAGLSPIRWRDYAIGTFLGMIPGTLAYVYLGGNLDFRSSQFWLAVGALLLLATGPFLYRRARAPSQSAAKISGEQKTDSE